MKFTFVLFITLLLNLSATSQPNTSQQGKQSIEKADSLLKYDNDAAIKAAKKVFRNYSNNARLMIDATSILAQAYRNKRIYDSVEYFCRISLQKAQQLQDTVNLIIAYLNLGSDYYLLADYARALEELKKSESLYKAFGIERKTDEISPLHYAKLLNNMATAYIKTGHYDSSLRCFIVSIKVKEANNAEPRTLIVSKINIGSIYLVLKDYNNSKQWMQEALHDATLEHDSLYMARCYSNLGVLYKKTGDTINAVENYEKALIINERKNDYRNQAIVLQNLALLLSSQKRFKEAYSYFTKALTNNNKIHANNSRLHLAMSRMFLQQKVYDSVVVHANLSIILARQSGNIDVQLEAYELLSKAYEGKKQFSLAFENIGKYIALKDSITTKENQQYIQSLKTEFETERKESEILFLKELNKSEHAKAVAVQSRQRIIISAVIIAFILLVVISLLYYGKKKRERTLYLVEKKLMKTDLKNRELEQKRLEIEIGYKTRQLTTHALNMLQKNQMLANILEKLETVTSSVDDEMAMKFRSIIKEIKKGQKTEKDWELFKNYFESINKKFNRRLNAINPKLSTHDYRLAALVSLNLNIKETAALLNISPNSVKIARYRLRKRLNMDNDDDLYTFLNKLKS